MKLRSALMAATVLVAPVAAKAQAIDGLYIGAGVGANYMQNQHIRGVTFPELAGNPAAPISGSNIQMDWGFVGLASIGYGLGNGLRFEIEGSYRQNDFNKAKHGPGVLANAGGQEYKYAGMFNVIYDIDPALLGGFALPFPVNPYIGVGAGYAQAKHNNARFYGATGPLPGQPAGYSTQLRSNDSDGNFAYQAIVGAAFPVDAVPGLSLTLEYRFMGLADNRKYNYQYLSNQPTPVGTATRARASFYDDYNHSVLVGVRYAFNAAPPPVAPPPPPAPRVETARTYLVFFDWDRADLTDRARQIIAEAAQATTRVQVTRIMVSGYTDTSGTARYNQGLSVRRAQNVAAELVRQGVPRNAITAQGFGETNPLVQTGNGVREPQNRRVEIVLQ